MLIDLRVGPLSEPLTGRSWGAPQVLERVQRRAAVYGRHGLSVGDRVFLHYGNCLEFFTDLLAIWQLGGCAVPVDPRLTPFEIDALARAARPRLSVWLETPDAAMTSALAALDVPLLSAMEEDTARAPAPPRDGVTLDHDALILFTSGTTGQPKGVVHTHRSLRARWMSLYQSLGVERYRRTLCLLPTHFGHGLICNALFPWLSGQHLFVLPPFRPDLLMGLGTLIDDHRITFMSSVPPVWRFALKTARPPQSQTLERVFCGSAPLSATLWTSVREWTGTKDVFNAYGITETGSWLAGATDSALEPEDGLIGTAWGGVVRILRSGSTETPPAAAERCSTGESGYVWVNTPALMRGYLGRDDLTRQVVHDGWFLTGDIGIMDDRGILYLRGREREEINRGGMKIYPADIDAVAERFEAVSDVCAFGFDDALHGECVGMAIVLKAADDATVRDLHEWMSQHLARHKLPERWYVLDDIPRTSRGKINRDTVATRCAELQPVDLRRILRSRDS